MSWIYYIIFIFLVISSSVNCLDFDSDIGFGIRLDQFQWSIASPDGHDDVISELTLKDLCMYEVKAALKIVPFSHINLRLKGDYARIFSGKNQGSDYLESRGNKEFLRSISDADKGEAFDFSAALGYQSTWFNRSFTFNPLIGWSHHELHLKAPSVNQSLNLFGPTGTFLGLHSDFKAIWNGPWVGIDGAVSLIPCWSIKGTIEYHWVLFKGSGLWNLRDDYLRDFKQSAYGRGTCITLGTQYAWNCFLVGLEYDFIYMKASHGFDRIYTVFGNGTTRLNELAGNQ